MSESEKVLRGTLMSTKDRSITLCTIYTQDPDPDMKVYPNNCVVVRSSIMQETALKVSEYILDKIQNDPEMFGPDNNTFKFAFPNYGGAFVILQFTGLNMDAEAYDVLAYGMAKVLYMLIAEWTKKTYGRAETQNKVQKCIQCLADALDTVPAEGKPYVFI